MITTEIFRNSYYYIAPGFDFEPLSRFSHQSNTFLYANLFLKKSEVIEKLQSHFANNEFLELTSLTEYDDFDETRYFQLHENYRNHLANAIEWLTPKEQQEYKETFASAISLPQWMIKVNLIRKHLNRKVTLFYFTGEGLASYIALSQNGKYPPNILCTIQTGQLERPDGIMNRLFKLSGNSPNQWIRGFEPDFFTLKNNGLKRDSLFNTIGMDLQFSWDAKESFVVSSTSRHVKSFIKLEYAQGILKKPFKSFTANKLLYANLFDLYKTPSDIKKLFIVTEHFQQKQVEENPKYKFLTWETLLHRPCTKISLSKSFGNLESLSKSGRFNEIYFIPFGMEDEGELLAEFLSRKFPTPLIAVVNRPLDFIDLRFNL